MENHSKLFVLTIKNCYALIVLFSDNTEIIDSRLLMSFVKKLKIKRADSKKLTIKKAKVMKISKVKSIDG